MKKILAGLGLALAVTFTTNVFVAKALAGEVEALTPQRGGPGMMHMMSVFSELDLTREQKEAIKALRHDAWATIKANKGEHLDFRDQMQGLVRAENFDEVAVRELMASKHERRLQMGIMHAKMRNGIWNILNQEQRALLSELKAKRGEEQGQGWGERGHHKGKHHRRHHGDHAQDQRQDQNEDQGDDQ
ncbi:MAG: protein CpxP [Alteromonadaceae bacterium]|jgi:protein CpxP